MLLPLGMLPRESVTVLWLLFNLSLVFLVARELKALARAKEISSMFFLGLVGVWPAVSICIAREQFSMLFFYCILVAHRIHVRHPIVAGLLYSLSFVKPSLAIPFLALPLLERDTGIENKTKTFITLASSQLVLLASMCWMVQGEST